MDVIKTNKEKRLCDKSVNWLFVVPVVCLTIAFSPARALAQEEKVDSLQSQVVVSTYGDFPGQSSRGFALRPAVGAFIGKRNWSLKMGYRYTTDRDRRATTEQIVVEDVNPVITQANGVGSNFQRRHDYFLSLNFLPAEGHHLTVDFSGYRISPMSTEVQMNDVIPLLAFSHDIIGVRENRNRAFVSAAGLDYQWKINGFDNLNLKLGYLNRDAADDNCHSLGGIEKSHILLKDIRRYDLHSNVFDLEVMFAKSLIDAHLSLNVGGKVISLNHNITEISDGVGRESTQSLRRGLGTVGATWKSGVAKLENVLNLSALNRRSGGGFPRKPLLFHPRLNWEFQFSPVFNAGVVAERAVTEPTMKMTDVIGRRESEVMIYQGNSTLREAKTDALSLSLSFDGKENVVTTQAVKLYALLYRDLIAENLTPTDEGELQRSYVNFGKAKSFGIGYSVGMAPTKWWSVDANLSLEFLKNDAAWEIKRHRYFSADLEMKFNVNRIGDFLLTMPYTTTHVIGNMEYGGNFDVNLSWRRAFCGKSLIIAAGVKDLFDTSDDSLKFRSANVCYDCSHKSLTQRFWMNVSYCFSLSRKLPRQNAATTSPSERYAELTKLL